MPPAVGGRALDRKTRLDRYNPVPVVDAAAIHHTNREDAGPTRRPADKAIVGQVGVGGHQIAVLVVDIQVEVGVAVADDGKADILAATEHKTIRVGAMSANGINVVNGLSRGDLPKRGEEDDDGGCDEILLHDVPFRIGPPAKRGQGRRCVV